MARINNIVDLLPKGRGFYVQRSEDRITDLVIHHSAAPQHFGAFDFAEWHIGKNGWPAIGYHYVIESDGKIYLTNYHTSISYHTGGHNSYTLGICLAGDFTKYAPAKQQEDSLVWLLRKLKRELPNAEEIKGHRDYKSTTCPAIDIAPIKAKAEKRYVGIKVASLAFAVLMVALIFYFRSI
jgi:N-acetylmuramoyl-L-alanine amidase